MKVMMETFESPSTTQPSDASGREAQYKLKVDELEKYLKEGNVEKVKETNMNIKADLIHYIQEIENTRKTLESQEKDQMYDPDVIIDNTKELQLKGHANEILLKRLTFRRKYENVKTYDLLDKKRIMVLYIINAFLLLVLVYGCFLVFKEQTYSLDFIKSKFSSSKKSNNRNNNRNNNSNNNSSS